MGDDTVSGNRFRNPDRPGSIAHEEILDAPMLIPESNFKMQYLFTPTVKAEMSRLNDSGMHRPDANLVDAVALDRKKRIAFDNTVSFW